MKVILSKLGLGSVLGLILVGSQLGIAQDSKEWVRVRTGADSMIHVDETSLEFRSDASGYSADFKTKLADSEPVPGRKPLKYRSRIDRIEFGRGYRILSTKFLDGSGAVVHTVEYGSDAPWRASFGGTARAMASVVRKLNPFGMWEVMEYRYATGETGSPDDDQDLRDLTGSKLRFEPDYAIIGNRSYTISSVHGKKVSNVDAKKYFDTSLVALGIEGDNLSAVRFTVANGGGPKQSFLLRVNPERAIMLWEGVFLELRRVPSVF
ncbi:MAG TPA: hypothetical protein VFZ49_08370 [Pyrinomonadaceae bacterium]